MNEIDLIRSMVIAPALSAIGAYSDEALDMVLVTGAAESLYQHTRQVGGPALGWWQMEPATHNDIWSHYLGPTHRQHLLDGLQEISRRPGVSADLEVNPWYAAAMTRIHYMRFREALPPAGDRVAQGRYWKKYYNTSAGRGTTDGFLQKVHAVIDA